MLELRSHDFFHTLQVLNFKVYKDADVENLKKMFTSEGKDHEEKLRLMKLEQDAAAK